MPELFALDGRHYVASPVCAFHGVTHPAAEDGAIARHGTGYQGIEIPLGQTGTGGVVHQYPLLLCHMQGVEHRIGTLASPFHSQNARVGRHGQLLEPLIVRRQRHYHPGYGRMGQ
ncbi:hypothetical protein D3C75_746890 [compost metagenome]